MKLLQRLGRFSIVGLFSTAIHGLLLAALVFFTNVIWAANLLGFLGAFLFSFLVQQRISFDDLLNGRSLNRTAFLILLTTNSILAVGLGSLAGNTTVFLLPIVPAMVNYTLFRFFSTSRFFTRLRSVKR